MKAVHESGKRKRAIAKATAYPGTGIVRINRILLGNYTPSLYRAKISEPLVLAGDAAQKVDINVKVIGGGMSSQADAARLAIAKSLVAVNKGSKLRDLFLQYDRNMLVADVRRKEARKPNRHGKARAKVQKSYR
ncbi:TPA: 30S ribosomal protein S9 [Candidatus Woesearchaeota archaeon]|nr:30S ribosomal protein S9 [Candidatus Woesearchaeota archaeon]HIH05161.1 30S ribosomal protein S9 [Candidatus Woesearchaeota archaeon]HIH91231.1 30S ribosomal protein S9 [Candidatus Woesearchaeota archaeon]HII64870.1 30S ribosomal protein S9 [Candidatus Woesearchaeota archaeon]HII65720.1 30S ribosomal protein S9 [Candidatus Woesearchaeota archaeon]